MSLGTFFTLSWYNFFVFYVTNLSGFLVQIVCIIVIIIYSITMAVFGLVFDFLPYNSQLALISEDDTYDPNSYYPMNG